MYVQQPVPEALRRLATAQSGALTREQALGLGLSAEGVKRMLREGHWQRLSRGVYATTPIDPPWPLLAWAGVLLGGDGARLAGRAAAHLHGIDPQPPETIQVLVPAARSSPTSRDPWVFRREREGVRSPKSLGTPPRTTVEDTILDLIEDLDADQRAAVHWIASAVQTRRTTPERIWRAAERRRFLKHRSLLRDILPDVVSGVRSPLELDYLRRVERPHGLPVGRRQRSRRGTDVDVWYEAFRLLAELDGLLGHDGAGRFRDMRRDNAATSDGLATLRYGSFDVRQNSCEVAFEVGGNLALRGWTGPTERCPGCRRVV